MGKERSYTSKAFSRQDIIDSTRDLSKKYGFDGTAWELYSARFKGNADWLESRTETLIRCAIEHGKELKQVEIKEALGLTI